MAAVAFDAASTAAGTSDPLTVSHAGSASATCAVVGVMIPSGTDDITAMTYGGVAMTLLQEDIGTVGGESFSSFYLIGPPTGTQTVSVTRGSPGAITRMVVMTFTGTAERVINLNTAIHTTSPLTLAVTSVDGTNALCAMLVGCNINKQSTASAGETRQASVAGTSVTAEGYTADANGSRTFAPTWSGGVPTFAVHGFSIEPNAAAQQIALPVMDLPRSRIFSIGLRTFLSQGLLSSTLLGQGKYYSAPGEVPSYDWPNPRGRAAPITNRSELNPSFPRLSGQGKYYAAPGEVPSYDWPNPRGREFPITGRTELNASYPRLQGEESFYGYPIAAHDREWPNPRYRPTPLGQRNHEFVNRMVTLYIGVLYGALGEVPAYDWPNPRYRQPAPGLTIWIERKSIAVPERILRRERFRLGTCIKFGTSYVLGGPDPEDSSPQPCGTICDVAYDPESSESETLSDESTSQPVYYQTKSVLVRVSAGGLLVVDNVEALIEYFILRDPAGNNYLWTVSGDTGLYTLDPITTTIPYEAVTLYDPDKIPWAVSVTLGGLLTWTNGSEIYTQEGDCN